MFNYCKQKQNVCLSKLYYLLTQWRNDCLWIIKSMNYIHASLCNTTLSTALVIFLLQCCLLVVELITSFHDAAFLLSPANSYTTFCINCGRGESLGTATCPKTVDRTSKVMLPEKYYRSNKASFCVHETS